MKGPINIRNAMDDPATCKSVGDKVTLLRLAMAQIFNADPEHIAEHQAEAITAAALFAGMTVGHMIAIGVMNEQDKRRAGHVLLANFRSGIEMGKDEARKAMLEQLPTEGEA